MNKSNEMQFCSKQNVRDKKKLLLSVWNWKSKRHHFKLSSTVNCGFEVLVPELFFRDCMIVWQSEPEGFSLKKPSRGLQPTLLAPCECIIQHQVVNKIQIRIKIKLEKKMHHLIIWTDCFDWETRCPWHKVKDLNQFYQWTYCYTFMHKS